MSEKRWKLRLKSFDKAVSNLLKYKDNVLADELSKAGFIQLFEIAMELCWKTLKDYLESESGIMVNSPKETIRSAFQCGVVQDGDILLKALQARNLTSHIYSEDVTEEIICEIRENYIVCIVETLENLKQD
ncbi:MAG: HI0074 family nucleotidyltransferase substrate-binding subunit [Eubacteriales bacterium]